MAPLALAHDTPLCCGTPVGKHCSGPITSIVFGLYSYLGRATYGSILGSLIRVETALIVTGRGLGR